MTWALVLGLCLGDAIKGPSLVLGLLLNPFLSLKFGLVFWACAPIILNPISYPPPPPPQPLTKASVGKGCIVSQIRGDTYVATHEGFDLGFVVVQCLVIMMASRFLHLFWLWLLASLKTSLDRLHFVPLFLKLFYLCKFGLPVFLNFVRLLFRTAFGGP